MQRSTEMEALVGAHPYFYFTPYQKDIHAALQALREREFKAGRYDPAMQMTDPPSYMFQMRFHLMKAGRLLEPSLRQSKRRWKHLRNLAPGRYSTFHGLAAHQTFSRSARWTTEN